MRPARKGERLGIIAGGGVLPRLVAGAARDAGWDPFVVPIADGRDEDWQAFDHQPLPWRRTGDIFGVLKRRGANVAVFCGTITVRPDYRSLVPSLRTLLMLPELLRMVQGGDDSLLRAVSGAFAKRGIQVASVQAIVPELLTPQGLVSRREPARAELDAVARAAEAATKLGLLDIGQAAVASCDRVIALEGIEGTSEMLARVADLKARGRIGRGEPIALFKAFKPQQDERFDLPSIGLDTVRQAKDAGLAGIALTAGRSLVIGRDDVLTAVDEAGLFLLGVPPREPAP